MDKSDVYVFGVVFLELLIFCVLIEYGKYIVCEVWIVLDKGGMDVFEFLLDFCVFEVFWEDLKKFFDLVFDCVEERGVDCFIMNEVVKEFEVIV